MGMALRRFVLSGIALGIALAGLLRWDRFSSALAMAPHAVCDPLVDQDGVWARGEHLGGRRVPPRLPCGHHPWCIAAWARHYARRRATATAGADRRAIGRRRASTFPRVAL